MERFADIAGDALLHSLKTNDEMIRCIQSRLFSFIKPPELLDGSDWNYEYFFDDKPWFYVKYKDKLFGSGPLQAISAYNTKTDVWRWIWNDDSLDQKTWEQSREVLEGFEEAAPILAHKEFKIDWDNAVQLAFWLGFQLCDLGAYPVKRGDEYVWSAVNISCKDENGFGWDKNFWCCFCGRLPGESKSLIKLPLLYICEHCIELFAGIKNEMLEADRPEWTDPAYMPSCIGCAQRTERIFSDYTALCLDCIELLEDMMKQVKDDDAEQSMTYERN